MRYLIHSLSSLILIAATAAYGATGTAVTSCATDDDVEKCEQNWGRNQGGYIGFSR